MQQPTRHGVPWDGTTIFFIAVIALNSLFVFWLYPLFFHSINSDYQYASFHDYYDDIARNLLDGHGFRLSPDTAETMVRGPTYIVFLAALFYLFSDSIIVAQAANVIFISVAAFFLYHFTYEARFDRVSPGIARAAVILFMAHPMIIGIELRGDPLCLFMMLCVIIAWVVQRALVRRRLRYFILAGVALALAALTRGTAVVLGAGVILLLLRAMLCHVASRQLALQIAVFGVILLVTMTPWIARNYLISGSFVPMSTISGDAMFQGMYVNQHMGFTGRHDDIVRQGSERQEEILRARGVDFRAGFVQRFFDVRSEVEHSRHLQNLVVETYKTEPWFALESFSRNMMRFWIQGRHTRVTLLYACIQIPFLLLALWGGILAVRHGEPRVDVAVTVIVTIWLAHSLTIAHAKHSTAALPFLSIFVAISLWRLHAWLRQKCKWRIGP